MSEEKQNNDAKIVMGSRAEEIVKCNKCGKEIKVGERHSFQSKKGEDIYFCDECMQEINTELENETKNQSIVGASILGTAAGIVGGFLWFLISVITGRQIGYMAIGLGWLIAMGVRLGAGNKKGHNLQILSAAIMVVCLLISEFMIFMYYVGQQPDVNMSAVNLLLDTISKGYMGNAISFFIKNSISPIGLLIWGIGIYTAYIIPKPKKL